MKASETLAANLQKVLVDLIDLGVQGKQAHWNVVGKNFRDLHLQLDEIIADARLFGDEIAERMRALECTPDGRAATVAKATSLPAYPKGEVQTAKTVDLVTERLDAMSQCLRDVHDQVEEEDPSTGDLLHAIILAMEKHRWMVSSENR